MLIYRAPIEEDIAALAQLGRDTFVDTFGHLYSAQDLNNFLSRVFSIEGVTGDWSDPNQLYRVAEDDGLLVGYCKLGFTHALDFDPGPDRYVIELKQLYLRKSYKGAGVGARLMEWALSEARDRQAHDMILSVWVDNDRAQRFYKRFGFQFVKDIIFMVGEQADHDQLFHLKLRD